MIRSTAVIVAAVMAASPGLAAQDAAQGPVARELRVFFDCNANCDENYLQTETPWVAFVRDRTVADVHVLVTRLGTGGGGQEYTIAFVGLGPFAGRADTLRFNLHAGDTDDVGRQGLTRTIQLGLAPFVGRTAMATRLRMEIADEDDDRRATMTPANDPWRAWVFEVEADASLEKEQRQSQLDWGASFDARRVTSMWKFGVSANSSFDETRFTLEADEEDGEPEREVVNVRESYDGGAVIVRSHGPRWGSGFQVSMSSSTFANTSFAFRAAPAVEFSVFPYDEFTRRQLTLQYSVGVSAFRYREETIYGRLRETRPTHSLVLGYDVNQPWGQADLTLESARYIDNASQWRLELDGEIDVRITRGLSVQLEGSASLIRDQLSIAARDATPEEILLELRDLETDYQYDIRIGLSYTFGSIFNTVVNPRFGTGPGNILRTGGGNNNNRFRR